jgi:hypothetical protein
VNIERAEMLQGGWKLWQAWREEIVSGNRIEINTLEGGSGRYLGYLKVVVRTNQNVRMKDPMIKIPDDHDAKPLLC